MKQQLTLLLLLLTLPFTSILNSLQAARDISFRGLCTRNTLKHLIWFAAVVWRFYLQSTFVTLVIMTGVQTEQGRGRGGGGEGGFKGGGEKRLIFSTCSWCLDQY